MSKKNNNNPKPGTDEAYYSLVPGAEARLKLPLAEEQSSWDGEFTKAHCDALILALARGQGTFSQAQVANLEKWAQQVMCNYITLELIFQGLVKVGIRADGELVVSGVLPQDGSDAGLAKELPPADGGTWVLGGQPRS